MKLGSSPLSASLPSQDSHDQRGPLHPERARQPDASRSSQAWASDGIDNAVHGFGALNLERKSPISPCGACRSDDAAPNGRDLTLPWRRPQPPEAYVKSAECPAWRRNAPQPWDFVRSASWPGPPEKALHSQRYSSDCRQWRQAASKVATGLDTSEPCLAPDTISASTGSSNTDFDSQLVHRREGISKPSSLTDEGDFQCSPVFVSSRAKGHEGDVHARIRVLVAQKKYADAEALLARALVFYPRDERCHREMLLVLGLQCTVDRLSDRVEWMKSVNLIFDAKMYEALIDAYVSADSASGVWWTFQAMKAEGVEVLPMTYGHLCNTFARFLDVHRAWPVFLEANEAGVELGLKTYMALIVLLVTKNRMDEAWFVYETMKQRGLRGNSFLFCRLADGFYKSGRFLEGAKKLIKENVDDDALGAIADLYRKAEDYETCTEVCEEILSRNSSDTNQYHRAWATRLLAFEYTSRKNFTTSHKSPSFTRDSEHSVRIL